MDREAVMIFQVCCNQVIAGASGVIDINLATIMTMMDRYGVADQIHCLDRVRIMFAEYETAMREKDKDRG